ncbi:glycosyltransferase family 39 protein [Schlesneria sp. T3-172]|uniref:glycosyltransferase family 39 protein n=2 Tax=Schlesneria TaxID=656899 RepID=UPI0037C71489
MPKPAESRWGILLLAVAVLSAIALMIPFLSAGPLTLDEHCSYWLIESDVPSTILERSLTEAAIPPLSAWFQWCLIQIGGRNELMLRLGSAIPYVLAIPVMFRLGKDLGGSMVGGISCLILAWHPEAMDEVRIGRCYGLMILLSAVSFLVTVRWLKSPSRWSYAILWGLIGGALLWTHYLTAPVLAVQLVVLLGLFRIGSTASRPPLMHLAAGVLIVVAFGVPLVPSVIRMAEWNSAFGFGQQPTPLWELFGPIWVVGLVVGLVMAKLVTGRSLSKPYEVNSRHALVVLLVWGLAPLVMMAVVTHLGMPGLNNPRYRVAFAVPGACCLALLLVRYHSPVGAAVGAVALLVAAWSLETHRVWQPGRVSGVERFHWREIALTIERDAQPGEPVFVQSGLMEGFLVPQFFNDPLFMDYVACRVSKFYLPSFHPRYALPFLWNGGAPLIDYYRTLIRQHGDQSRAVWVACATDTDLCRNSLPAMHLLLSEAGYQLVDRQTHSTAELVRYELREGRKVLPSDATR